MFTVCVQLCKHVYAQGLGELLHLAAGKNQLDIVIEHHNVDPTCAGQVRIHITYNNKAVYVSIYVLVYSTAQV